MFERDRIGSWQGEADVSWRECGWTCGRRDDRAVVTWLRFLIANINAWLRGMVMLASSTVQPLFWKIVYRVSMTCRVSKLRRWYRSGVTWCIRFIWLKLKKGSRPSPRFLPLPVRVEKVTLLHCPATTSASNQLRRVYCEQSSILHAGKIRVERLATWDNWLGKIHNHKSLRCQPTPDPLHMLSLWASKRSAR